MLRTFIRFSEVEDCQNPCVEDSTCFNSSPNYESTLPAIAGDVFKFIVNKSDANFWDAQHIGIGIAQDCGPFIQNVGTVEQSETQYFITATIPVLQGPHRFVIYNALNITLFSFTPETSLDACDAIATFEIPNSPGESFEWSIDGINYQESSTFTGLCMEPIIVYVRIVGDACTSGEKEFDLSFSDCQYSGFTVADMADIYLFQVSNCTFNDFV